MGTLIQGHRCPSKGNIGAHGQKTSKKHSKQAANLRVERPQTESKPVDTLTLNLQPPELQEQKCLLSKPHCVAIVMTAQLTHMGPLGAEKDQAGPSPEPQCPRWSSLVTCGFLNLNLKLKIQFLGYTR